MSAEQARINAVKQVRLEGTMQHLIKLDCGMTSVLCVCALAQAQGFPSRSPILIAPWLTGKSLARKIWRQSIDYYPKHAQEELRNEKALIERAV